jgi:hypothetical protein
MTIVNFPRALLWPVLATCLAACGGGGSSAPAPVYGTCTLALNGYANGQSSGVDILQNGPTQAASRPLTGCDISQLQSAQLKLCVQHTQLQELTAQLTLPVFSSTLGDLSPDTSASVADINFCTFNNGSLYTVSLPPSVISAVSSLNTSWNVAVVDQISNSNSGKFIGWSLILTGQK